MANTEEINRLEKQVEILKTGLYEVEMLYGGYKEPEYQVWGDTEEAEIWGQEHGRWEAAQIARKALLSSGVIRGRNYLVVGLHEDGTRWANEYLATCPEEAEAMAPDGIKVAASVTIIEGRMEVDE